MRRTTALEQCPISGHLFYDVGNSLITPENEGDGYVIGVRLNAESNNVAGAFELTLNLDGIILDMGTLTFPKGSGTVHTFDKTSNIFVGSTFIISSTMSYIIVIDATVTT